MLPTPFAEDGKVDVRPIPRLIECAANAGCKGVVALGIMGEAHRLSDTERTLLMNTVLDQADGKLTVTLGVSAQSGHLAAERTRDASNAGASAVMACPASLGKPNPAATFAYFADIEENTDIPIVVQDLPLETGVFLDPVFIAHLNEKLPHAKYLKLEDSPTPPKVTRVLEATKGRIGVFGGLGGAFLFEELRRGAIGTMTGFAYPEVLVNVHRCIEKGMVERAREIFYRWLPLIRYENQTGIGLSIRKHIMHLRGLLDSPAVREPTPQADQATLNELQDILGAMNLEKKGT